MQNVLVSHIATLPVLKRIGDACDFRFLTLHPFYPASLIVIADSDEHVCINFITAAPTSCHCNRRGSCLQQLSVKAKFHYASSSELAPNQLV